MTNFALKNLSEISVANYYMHFVNFREDLQLIQREISQLSEQYTIKCLENASLDERLNMQTKSLHESRKRVQDLMARYM